MQATIRAFFDEPTNTVSYLVSDPSTKKAAIIDSVMDFDNKSGKASYKSAEAMLQAAHADGLGGLGADRLLPSGGSPVDDQHRHRRRRGHHRAGGRAGRGRQ